METQHEPDRTPIVLLEEIFPGDTNSYGTAFGGKILALMDRAAGLAASRYARAHFVTASMDTVKFRAPVRQGEIAEVVAHVVYTSRRTRGVRVEVFAVDKVSWQRRACNSGLIFMVAMGPEGRPMPVVPAFDPASPDERRQWDEAAAVHRQMLAGRPAR